ncbi:MAG: hypothetical protein AABY28_03975 [Candidatus Omnitrophota bacterium]
MIDRDLVQKIKNLKVQKGYTLYDLSRILDIPISTLQRWLKTSHINRIYARLVKERLGI